MSFRAFVAIQPDRAFREAFGRALKNLREALNLPNSRDVRLTWVQPDVAHLTLKFLGDIDDALVEPLRARIGEAVGPHARASLPLTRLGGYPKLEAPRTLWLGPAERWLATEDARLLLKMQAAVEQAAVAAGATPDPKPWSPHLTLVRIRHGERRIGRALRETGVADRSLDLPSLEVRELVLVRSELTSKGPVHTPVWVIRLTRSDDASASPRD